LSYPMLGEVTGADESLLLYCLALAVGDTFYWTCYHAYFALLGDNEHRGHQVSAGVALSALVGIAAPLLGAASLEMLGPLPTFGVVGLVQVISVAPLLAIPQVQVPRTAPASFRAAIPGVALFMTDGWFSVSFIIVWQIALFVSLGSSLSAYGGAMALAA